MKENYTFPVILEEEKECFLLTFPSFDWMVSQTDEKKDYIQAAQEVIALEVLDAEEEGRSLVENPENIELEEGQRLIYVNVWMPYHRTTVKTVYIRKNVTIPAWLDALAKKAGINFSEILTEALREKLFKRGFCKNTV